VLKSTAAIGPLRSETKRRVEEEEYRRLVFSWRGGACWVLSTGTVFVTSVVPYGMDLLTRRAKPIVVW